MIIFKKCRWRNFLSTGNDFTEILLDKSPTTLIVGQNGAGKSTLLDALSFGLFGKPHRDIKKPQLINSINNKNCLVEVEFSVGNSEFKLVRGMKPNRFEIWQNGVMINQDANAKDYQKYLEQNILKLNHKSFHQVVVLGSTSFIPFMQLPLGIRRSLIEDLLDINIFSKMNIALKERNSKLRDKIQGIDQEVAIVNTKIASQNKYVRDLQAINNNLIEEKRESINDYNAQISKLLDDSTQLGENLTALLLEQETEQTALYNKINRFTACNHQFEGNIKTLVKEGKFFEENHSCPTCSQEISEEKRNEKITEVKSKAKSVYQSREEVSTKITELQASLSAVEQTISELKSRQNRINLNTNNINLLRNSITKTQAEIDKLTGQTGDINEAKKDLEGLSTEKNDLLELKLKLTEQRTYNEAISEMLKDTGIKTKIIKQYLPVMNKLINHYLQILDFFVSFHIDENFNETIKSRYRDDFNYASFSEGEKSRIDLALLFTWRQIAKMKNSASTNLLVLDETFDSSLDVDGVDNLIKIIGTLENGTNVFIISHKGDILENKFRSKIEFHKEKNFSKMKK